MRKGLLFLTLALALLLQACSTLPSQVERTPSSALQNTQDTALGKALAERSARQPGLSGIHALGLGREAFAARVLLAKTAQRSLDLQYYIWHGDTTGQMLAQVIWEAAERGVRVRLLLDDANTGGLDEMLSALDAHPNIELRLFNPFANRGFRLGDFATDFSRVNHRMHNKSFTADNQASIVGGRNVGNEYFGADPHVGFQDLDVLAVGPVVQEVSREFDAYWNDAGAYPVASLVRAEPAEASRALLEQRWAKVRDDPEAQRYVQAVRETSLMRDLLEGRLDLEWAQAHVIADDPGKVRQRGERTELLLLPRLAQAMGRPAKELDLVSPYFVPGKEGTRGLSELAKSGVQVRVLTNSLSATDVGPVHAGYSKYREDLLRAGVHLYELKRSATGLPSKAQERHRGPGSSSDVSLHAKSFGVDRVRIFVGSFNLDPRSAHLNTEMGIVIESPVLASRLSDELTQETPEEAFELRLAPEGRGIEWIERTPEGEKRYTSEPKVGVLRRMWVEFLSWLPIEWLL